MPLEPSDLSAPFGRSAYDDIRQEKFLFVQQGLREFSFQILQEMKRRRVVAAGSDQGKLPILFDKAALLFRFLALKGIFRPQKGGFKDGTC
jgi:hypothetical protein